MELRCLSLYAPMSNWTPALLMLGAVLADEMWEILIYVFLSSKLSGDDFKPPLTF